MLVPAEGLSSRGECRHLVLVTGENPIRAPPAQLLVDLHFLDPYPPTTLRLDHRAAQRLGDELMSEADPDEGGSSAGNLADERLEVSNPGLVVVDRMTRAGRQPGVGITRARRQNPIDGVVSDDLDVAAAGKQTTEHVLVVPEDAEELGAHVVTNEKADSHFVILIGRRNKKGLEGPDSPFCSLE
jgi:hypothetical protein